MWVKRLEITPMKYHLKYIFSNDDQALSVSNQYFGYSEILEPLLPESHTQTLSARSFHGVVIFIVASLLKNLLCLK